MANIARRRDSQRISRGALGSRGSGGGSGVGGAGSGELGAEGGARGGESDAERPFEMRLTLPQIVVLWSVLAGAMVMVFLFGLYAGRDQGVRAALEERSGDTEAVRLPVRGGAIGNSDRTPPGGASAATAGGPAADDIAGKTGLKADGSVVGVGSPDQSAGLPQVDSGAVGDNGAIGEKGAGPASVTDELGGERTASTEGAVSEPGVSRGIGSAKSRGGAETSAGDEAPTLAAESERRGGGMREDERSVARKGSTESPVASKAELKLKDGRADAKPSDSRSNGANARPIATTSLTSGWYLQVAAARTKSEATAIMEKLQKSKISTRLEEARVGPNVYYRVVLGPYSDKDQALALRNRVKASGAVKGDPFLKSVR